MFQWTTVVYSTTYTVWTFPTAFISFVMGFIYSQGVKNTNWNHTNFMESCKGDYILLTSLNLFAHNLGEQIITVPGFALVYGV